MTLRSNNLFGTLRLRLRPTMSLGLMLGLILGLMALAGVAHARGGQAADDCPPGSKDPDCAMDGRRP